MESFISDARMIYGSEYENMTQANHSPRRVDLRLNLYIMRHIRVGKMQKNENYFSNPDGDGNTFKEPCIII